MIPIPCRGEHLLRTRGNPVCPRCHVLWWAFIDGHLPSGWRRELNRNAREFTGARMFVRRP